MNQTKKKINDLLNDEEFAWPDDLQSNKRYFAINDDCDGDFSEGLSVTFGVDGDAHVHTHNRPMHSCRFRTYEGGGRCLRVRKALMILALAIEQDNIENNKI